MKGSSLHHAPTHPDLKRLKKYILELDDKDLPGHMELEIGDGLRHHQTPVTPDATPAAVTLIIHATSGTPSIVFIERTQHFGPVQHRGQIAFPGGKREEAESLKACAFRETEEEIGISLVHCEPTKSLTPLFVPVSNFIIHPFVVFQESLPTFSPNPEEVKQVINSPLIDFLQQDIIHKKDIRVRDRILKNVPYFQLQDKVLWGASALIFSEFLYLLNEFQKEESAP